MIIVKSKIKQGGIPLPKRVRLQEGTKVLVKIEPIFQKKDKLRILSDLADSWASDPSVIEIFDEIEKERHSDTGREVRFE